MTVYVNVRVQLQSSNGPRVGNLLAVLTLEIFESKVETDVAFLDL